mmetsp:Transcript_19873/g.25383  ORF Transcript_19873/g.25383 Transcript_19873/m.25383 type:complete len:126 (-) Transcript_19873:89-466(-)
MPQVKQSPKTSASPIVSPFPRGLVRRGGADFKASLGSAYITSYSSFALRFFGLDLPLLLLLLRVVLLDSLTLATDSWSEEIDLLLRERFRLLSDTADIFVRERRQDEVIDSERERDCDACEPDES